MSDLFGSAHIEDCRDRQHRLRTVWSDKTPMKVNILCQTCTERTHRSVYVAYGVPEKSWGAWRPRERETPLEAAPEAVEVE
jgi:hypothetical protein